MKRTTLIVAGVALACILIVVIRQLAQPGHIKPIEVPVTETSTWIRELQKPGEVIFRAEARSKTQPKSADIAGKSVVTFGLLAGAEEAVFVSDIETQLRSLEQQIDNHKGPDTTDPLAELRNALDAAELIWQKARLEVAVDMIKSHDYATIKSNGTRPPQVDDFDRIIHGPVTRVNGEPLDAVLYVSLKDERLKDSLDYWSSLHQAYWSQHVAAFNSLPLDERQRRIALHGEAIEQRSKPDARGRLTPKELQEAVISGPIVIDDKTSTLRIRR